MTRVAFYTRISTDDDRQKFSLAAQRERLEAHCKAQYGDDWTLAGIYSDQESGSRASRPDLNRLFADARAHTFDVLLVFKVDRLSRKILDVLHFVDDLRTLGIRLVSITESFDTTT